MIRYATGNLLLANADALVNTVNTVGVMGKGVYGGTPQNSTTQRGRIG